MKSAAFALIAALVAGPAAARTIEAPATPGRAAAALAAAADGDTVRLASGVHAGPLTLAHRIVLRGAPGAIVDGGGNGCVLTVLASGAEVSDLAIRSSGRRVITIDAGLRVLSAQNVHLSRLRLTDVLYGIYAERAARVPEVDAVPFAILASGRDARGVEPAP